MYLQLIFNPALFGILMCYKKHKAAKSNPVDPKKIGKFEIVHILFSG